jgi:hypothetical protein
VAKIGHVKNRIHSFSSCDFISGAHKGQELEAEHESMQEVEYKCFVEDGIRATVVFGTQKAAILAQEIMDKILQRKISLTYVRRLA